ncbi:outer membrane-stress sensor serine endopeptidase DegS [Xenorhabdus nematophila]|uniref:Serine endoprotease DegS n=1 Tax=Xenorhabdus nematophila (strain ATCC 19061 / DSM 3370 / CCUG 14189 / LMG 1036 / NCIMB 9965 / AN6) TaxID=406817 RepID=D3VDG7_XENNA|nr:outer membrane-stress sensor serine endopeptidase DegS [Xenorhabdus nematophila]AYA42551.1 serine endoprotease DegS [Xenorhabdus nematophila]KHD28344.1 serine endoprotease [Xenorhabdus nematophila]MBA0020736.1 outer membrane-stress sensor serine endopeptidase DegS [Xenorhabdus nematophila]MCB4425427.1 outer membrane-stress sensor serine endopeptidase DegS [Xenorhabdus nematophila]QNJ38444.1 outer membrane-stress sensor serine endopeptidase DegS [Xenorhabdus nematophila]
MLIKLLRSIVIGLLIAAILLVAIPSLRPNGFKNLLSGNNNYSDKVYSFSQGVRRAAPAVVNIYSSSMGSFSHESRELQPLGSGVIMSDKGYILTNKHVINKAGSIIVALQDGHFYEALLVGSDGPTDLAVLKINATNLPVIPINPDRVPHVGDIVLAIGNPYNLGQTITQGIISATGRVGLSPTRRQYFLQTDASINQGNSGGALVNTLGELVGINTLTFDKSEFGTTPEGLGFAIPTKLATTIMQKLIRDGRVIRGYIGITARELPYIRSSGSNINQIQGLRVFQVAPSGPAEKAGIKAGDIIISVNRQPAISPMETMDQVAEIRPGSLVPVTVLRDGKSLTLNVTIDDFDGY